MLKVVYNGTGIQAKPSSRYGHFVWDPIQSGPSGPSTVGYEAYQADLLRQLSIQVDQI